MQVQRAPTLDQLEAFHAVATSEHITKTASVLGLSQSTLSHKLKDLAQALQLDLFERVGRRIQLTADGKALLPFVSAALAAHYAVGEAAAARQGVIYGNLSLAASNTVGVYRAPCWFSGFIERYPGVELRVRLVNTLEAIRLLRTGDVDCALIAAPGPSEGLDEIAIETDELMVVVAANHPLAQLNHQIRDEDLAEYCYLARELEASTEELAAQQLGSAYRTGRVLELGQLDAVRIATLTGLGYAVLPLAAIKDDLIIGRLRALTLGRPNLKRTLGALKRPTSRSPALEAFWTHLISISQSDAVQSSQLGGSKEQAGSENGNRVNRRASTPF